MFNMTIFCRQWRHQYILRLNKWFPLFIFPYLEIGRLGSYVLWAMCLVRSSVPSTTVARIFLKPACFLLRKATTLKSTIIGQFTSVYFKNISTIFRLSLFALSITEWVKGILGNLYPLWKRTALRFVGEMPPVRRYFSFIEQAFTSLL